MDFLGLIFLAASFSAACVDWNEKANLETVQLAKEYLTTHDGIIALDLCW